MGKVKQKESKSELELELQKMSEQRRQNDLIEEKKKSLADHKNSLKVKMDEAIAKYIDYEGRLGVDHQLTRFQATLVNLFEPLTNAVEMVLLMQDTMSIVDQSLSIVENTMSIIEEVVDPSRHEKAGLFNRLSAKKKMNGFMNTWNNNIKKIEALISSVSQGTQNIESNLKTMFGKQRNNSGLTSSGLNQNALDAVNRYKKERGIETTNTKVEDNGQSGSGASSSNSTNIDDII